MCSHHIVEDNIDIDPDRSKQIFYCELCEKTFDKDSIIYDKAEGKWIYTGEPPRELDAPEILPPRV
jgi:hypothetical protein